MEYLEKKEFVMINGGIVNVMMILPFGAKKVVWRNLMPRNLNIWATHKTWQ